MGELNEVTKGMGVARLQVEERLEPREVDSLVPLDKEEEDTLLSPSSLEEALRVWIRMEGIEEETGKEIVRCAKEEGII